MAGLTTAGGVILNMTVLRASGERSAANQLQLRGGFCIVRSARLHYKIVNGIRTIVLPCNRLDSWKLAGFKAF